MAPTVPEENQLSNAFLGRSGLKVSNICLGCMTFGPSTWGVPGHCDENLSHEILNRFEEWGGNFLDTADIYGRGQSEEIVGKWLETLMFSAMLTNAFENNDIGIDINYHMDGKLFNLRRLKVKTKIDSDTFRELLFADDCALYANSEESQGSNMGLEQNANNVGLSRRHITESIDGSLSRLRTNFVDLYQTHVWDDATPVEETLRTLDDLVRIGKVRYVGVSNVKGWQLQKLVDATVKLGVSLVVSLQQQYSLMSRESELEPFQVCKTAGIGVLPWSPLKGGLLTGRVKRGVKPTEGRIGWVAADEKKKLYSAPAYSTFDDKTFDIIELVEGIAKKHERTAAQVAIRWLLQRDVVSSVIIGARTVAQLDDNLSAGAGWSLSTEEMQQLDDISAQPQTYPYVMVSRANLDRHNPHADDLYVRSTDH